MYGMKCMQWNGMLRLKSMERNLSMKEMECDGICGLNVWNEMYTVECKYGMNEMECMERNTII